MIMYRIMLFDMEKFKFQIRTAGDKDIIIANSTDFKTAEKRNEVAQTLAEVIGCDIYGSPTLELVDPTVDND